MDAKMNHSVGEGAKVLEICTEGSLEKRELCLGEEKWKCFVGLYGCRTWALLKYKVKETIIGVGNEVLEINYKCDEP